MTAQEYVAKYRRIRQGVDAGLMTPLAATLLQDELARRFEESAR